ncbi:hypothetical protein E3A20_22390, partial [Planctomyces bekefii]
DAVHKRIYENYSTKKTIYSTSTEGSILVQTGGTDDIFVTYGNASTLLNMRAFRKNIKTFWQDPDLTIQESADPFGLLPDAKQRDAEPKHPGSKSMNPDEAHSASPASKPLPPDFLMDELKVEAEALERRIHDEQIDRSQTSADPAAMPPEHLLAATRLQPRDTEENPRLDVTEPSNQPPTGQSGSSGTYPTFLKPGNNKESDAFDPNSSQFTPMLMIAALYIIATTANMFFLLFLALRNKLPDVSKLPFFSISMILPSAVILVILGYSQEQIDSVLAIFASIVGYTLGQLKAGTAENARAHSHDAPESVASIPLSSARSKKEKGEGKSTQIPPA